LHSQSQVSDCSARIPPTVCSYQSLVQFTARILRKTDLPLKKKIRYGYDGVRDAARRLTGWRVSVGAANANAHKAVAGYVVVVGEFGKK
jgi:hypothetical protein